METRFGFRNSNTVVCAACSSGVLVPGLLLIPGKDVPPRWDGCFSAYHDGKHDSKHLISTIDPAYMVLLYPKAVQKLRASTVGAVLL